MSNRDLSIEVNARITVSDAMAERCLRLLEMWQEDNLDKYIDKVETKVEDNRFGERTIVEYSIEMR